MCSHRSAVAFYSMQNAPVTVASVFPNREQAMATPTGELSICVCRTCGFIFNEAFDPALGELGESYESSQAASPHFTAFARSLAAEWIKRYRLEGKTVLEVGCGSGAFLKTMIECGIGDAVGIDPLARASAAPEGARVMVRRFDSDCASIAADALVCRHTLEHVQDVRGFLAAVRNWATQDPARVVLFELPDAERIFSERAFWDIYYEHCNYFTAATLRRTFEAQGFRVLRCSRAYGDQYLILEAAATDAPVAPETFSYENAEALCKQFAQDVRGSIARCERELRKLAAEGAPVVIWQAASKTVGFLSALSNYDCIHSAVDLSEQRQGRFLPASGLAVHAPDKLREINPGHVVLMNPVYVREVAASVAALALSARVHTVNELLA